MILCARFLLPRLQLKVWSPYVVLTVSTGARGPVWIDREAQFAADAEEESHQGEAIFDAAAGLT